MPNQPPVHELRMGRIKACVWDNETTKGVRSSVTVARLYKDSDDWKESTSFGRDELPLLQAVLGKAYEWLYERPRDGGGEAES